ncbi:serine/threonine protein kinase [Vibrio albus]|uniref:Serine/threonine protein kinase n=1 Tax=Vibrio albus TaxID=2200953 RepID=A0A2U3B9V7_9VIBR|nr:bifunctional protein-serine/threonine kinase/phosphatase [Vibrio albus]PWI33557.1 serine/threonine protein kinase [Vibrio albus]
MPSQKEKQPQLSVTHAGSSLTGARKENQDAILVKVPEQQDALVHKGIVACIADGVSCSEHSQKASHTAVVQFINDYYATPDSWSIKHAAGKILTSLNSWLYVEGAKKGLSHNGLVTTFSCLIFKSNTAHLFHVGDTRIYRLRDNKFRLLTQDHQRINFGKSAYLTRALGMDSKLEVDYQMLSLREGDRFILTSDGVHDFIDERSLAEFTRTSHNIDLDELSREICNQALVNGSQDNLSCLILDVTHLPRHSALEHQQRILSRTIPPAMKTGNQIDNYRVDKVLYEGARSHVYQVTELSSDKQMVLKAPSMQYSEDRSYLRHFSNEAWVGSQINSERVMKMYPTPRESKFIYQLCELIEGITLRQWMYDNPRPDLHSVRVIIDELVKAVRVFQRADMVHRDLKPENVMISHSGSVKIIDLGAVKVSGLEEILPESPETIPLGAVNYIAPEYIQTGNATTISDLFSVAVIGYEMLTGQLPYKEVRGQNLQSARHTKWEYRPISQCRDDIPHWIDLAFKKATHHLPQRRYPALSEFTADLYTPNKLLQNEVKESPLIQRRPVLFWKATTLMAITVALLELVYIYTNMQ